MKSSEKCANVLYLVSLIIYILIILIQLLYTHNLHQSEIPCDRATLLNSKEADDVESQIAVVLLDLETSGFDKKSCVLQIGAKCGKKYFETYKSYETNCICSDNGQWFNVCTRRFILQWEKSIVDSFESDDCRISELVDVDWKKMLHRET